MGELQFVEGNPPAEPAPVAPDSPLGWSEPRYMNLWSRIVAQTLQAHATHVEQIPLGELGVVSPFESPPLYGFDALP